jgi:hypothetical protein
MWAGTKLKGIGLPKRNSVHKAGSNSNPLASTCIVRRFSLVSTVAGCFAPGTIEDVPPAASSSFLTRNAMRVRLIWSDSSSRSKERTS